MKAVYLLLCLAFVQGNIFHRRDYPRMRTIIFNSLPYKDELQKLQLKGYLPGNPEFSDIKENAVQPKEDKQQNWNQVQELVPLAQYEQEQQVQKKDKSQSNSSSNESSREIKRQPNAIQHPRLLQQQKWDQLIEPVEIIQWEQGRHNQEKDKTQSSSSSNESSRETEEHPKSNQNSLVTEQQNWSQLQEPILIAKGEQREQNQEKDKKQYDSVSNDSAQEIKEQSKENPNLQRTEQQNWDPFQEPEKQNQENDKSQSNSITDKNSEEINKQSKATQNLQHAEQQKEDHAQKQVQFSQQNSLSSQESEKSNSIKNSVELSNTEEPMQPESSNVNLVSPTNYHQYQSSPSYGDAAEWNGIKMAAYPTTVSRTKEAIANMFLDTYNSKNTVTDEKRIKFHEAYEAAAQANSEDTRLNATQLLNKYQYEVEQHIIKTEDGYILTLIRIPPKRMLRDVQKRPVVFLMHGLLGSADDWLLMGPGKSLAYLLADAGYDVWMGNARGNKYSRRHVWKHPVFPEFWQFSNDEISLIDLPAMIDYVSLNTNQEKMFYIGHSQGTTNFFALASTRPEYNAKITMMYALAPMAYMSNVRSPMLRMIAPTSQFEEQLQLQLGEGEFKPNREVIKTLGGDICEQQIGCRNVCSNVIFTISGVNIEGLDPTLLPVILSHLPAGTSSKLIRQYGQAVASLEFRRYDYGPRINNEVYGELQPPKYELKNVTVPVSMYWSEEDWLATPKDVEKLQKELPSMQDSYKVPEQHFNHLDYLLSAAAPELVYERLLNSIQQKLK